MCGKRYEKVHFSASTGGFEYECSNMLAKLPQLYVWIQTHSMNVNMMTIAGKVVT